MKSSAERATEYYEEGRLSLACDLAGCVVAYRDKDHDPTNPDLSPKRIADYTIRRLKECGNQDQELFGAITELARQLTEQTESL